MAQPVIQDSVTLAILSMETSQRMYLVLTSDGSAYLSYLRTRRGPNDTPSSPILQTNSKGLVFSERQTHLARSDFNMTFIRARSCPFVINKIYRVFANDSLTALQIVIPIRIVGHPTRPSPARTWSVGPTRPPAATVATGTSSALRSLRHRDRRRLSPPWRPGVKEREKREGEENERRSL